MGPVTQSQGLVTQNAIRPPSPSGERLSQKMSNISLSQSVNVPVNWDTSRAVTPGEMCGVKTSRGLFFMSKKGGTEGVQLFHSGWDSQGLVYEDNHVVGASVTTHIHRTTARGEEKKGTAFSYDKNRINQTQADFYVNSEKHSGRANYEGGHLIDHQYSAGNSHYAEGNYLPNHYFYNNPIKNVLVNRSDSYVEIPLYTPNPPMIGVKNNKQKEHPIPVGFIFVQIVGNRIQDVYFFPNNAFDYEGLKNRLGLKKTNIAETIIPYFKLKRSFHALLHPAIIVDFKNVQDGKSQQISQEEDSFSHLDDVSHGMTLMDCEEDQTDLSKLSFSVLNGGNVDPSLCLGCTPEQYSVFQGQPLSPAFNALGEFLVRYGIKNALKSEVISIKSRLVFINVVIDFIDAYHSVSGDAFEFIDSLAEEFSTALDELNKIKHTMNEEEFVFLLNTYKRLISQHNHFFSLESYDIYGEFDLENYLSKFVSLLKFFVSKYPIKALEKNSAWNFLEFVIEAQKTLNYLVELGNKEEEFRKEIKFLRSIREPTLALLDRLSGVNQSIKVDLETNTDRMMSIRTSVGYWKYMIASLGASDLDFEDEEDNSSSEEENFEVTTESIESVRSFFEKLRLANTKDT